jgi:uncharacterized membrane protein
MMNSYLTPKSMFIAIIVVFIGLALIDHLQSPTLRSTGAPADLGNACAPCGAPCK